ncbi:MAG: ASCH domain-containing protein [Acidobacteria bacterium]|nr:ASCH domain-containing protein [Acidobacteriota bacterium]
MINVILSIKPEFADAILSGKKKVEFRKTLFKKDVEKVFIYSTAPVKRITGYFTINEIIESPPFELWEKFGKRGFINEVDFFNYFKNKETGFSICIDMINKFSEAIDPFVEIENFVPPQSFRYISENELTLKQL